MRTVKLVREDAMISDRATPSRLRRSGMNQRSLLTRSYSGSNHTYVRLILYDSLLHCSTTCSTSIKVCTMKYAKIVKILETSQSADIWKTLKLLKENSHQILLSEMSLPGVEVPIEKLLPKILGRLGKENHSKRRCKVSCLCTAPVSHFPNRLLFRIICFSQCSPFPQIMPLFLRKRANYAFFFLSQLPTGNAQYCPYCIHVHV